jgi:hypothetical protein
MILRIVASFLFLSLFSLNLLCQDKLEIIGQAPIKVQIVEIGRTYISYTFWGQKEPLYRINSNQVSNIRYDRSLETIIQNARPDFAKEHYIVNLTGTNRFLVNDTFEKSFWELGEYMALDIVAAPLFARALKSRRTAKVSFRTGVGTFGVGVLALSTVDNFSDTAFAVGAISLVVAPFLLLNSLVFKISSGVKKRQAIAAYGIEYSSNFHVLPETNYLNIGLTANGVGITYNF